jgi:beta-lactamase regulating signal transducer with metallopeptidase domain
MTFPTFNFWSQLLATVGAEIFSVTVIAYAVQFALRSAIWQRTIWRIGVICLLLVPVSLWTGFGRAIAGYFLIQKPSAQETLPLLSAKPFPQMPSSLIPIPLYSAEAKSQPSVWWPGCLWLAGTATILARIVAAQILFLTLRMQREKIAAISLRERVRNVAKSLGLNRKIGLLRMPQSISPMAFGILRLHIGLPLEFETQFTTAEQEAILAHELAHLAAMDPLWFLLADLAVAFLWWHPFAWCVRRSLHASSELAADEAVTVVPDGPDLLASCLVVLGKQMTARSMWGWAGINGGFRSKLGKRVQRLIRMSNDPTQQFAPKAGLAGRVAATIVTIPTVILLFGAFQTANGQKQESWTGQIRESWHNSPGGLLTLAMLDETTKPTEGSAAKSQDHKIDVVLQIQKAKLLYEQGRLDESEAIFLRIRDDERANSGTVEYYLDLIAEARSRNSIRANQSHPTQIPLAQNDQSTPLYTKTFKVEPGIFTVDHLPVAITPNLGYDFDSGPRLPLF